MSALIVAFSWLLYLLHDVERGLGGISFVRMGRGNSRISGGFTLCHTQRSPTCWDPYIHICPCPYQEETETHSFHYTNSLIGGLVLVGRTLGVTPLSLSRPTMNTCTGRPNGKCIASVVDQHKLAQYSEVL